MTPSTFWASVPPAKPAILDPACTIPVRLPTKSVEVILLNPVPIPPVILIVPSRKVAAVKVPVPWTFKKFDADWLSPVVGSDASLLIASTAPNPAAPPDTISTILCIVKFFVGLSAAVASVPKT